MSPASLLSKFYILQSRERERDACVSMYWHVTNRRLGVLLVETQAILMGKLSSVQLVAQLINLVHSYSEYYPTVKCFKIQKQYVKGDIQRSNLPSNTDQHIPQLT